MEFLRDLSAALVPLLIAVDPAAVVVISLALTEGLELSERRRIQRQALVTALVIGFAFMFLGSAVFRFLGIDEADFQIGGGLILLVLSLADLVAGDRSARRLDEFVGIVPIGTPLIVGPAVLTAISLATQLEGTAVAAAAFCLTLLIVAGALFSAQAIARLLGVGGLKAVSKIISILLAAFAVRLIRTGAASILGLPV
jgi:multiple antibiotic resistance protein